MDDMFWACTEIQDGIDAIAFMRTRGDADMGETGQEDFTVAEIGYVLIDEQRHHDVECVIPTILTAFGMVDQCSIAGL